jgi:transcriptional regulator with XRE-family HTH domain
MISKDERAKIQELKSRGYSQSRVAQALKISRSTVARNWSSKKLTFDNLYLVSRCDTCGTVYPKPKFLTKWQCPYCKTSFHWKTPWFAPEWADTK